MRDSREVVLFFDENPEFKAVEVANEIVSRYPELGDVTVLPERKGNMPLVLFNTNPSFYLHVSRHSVNIIVDSSLFKDLHKIIFDMVDLFDDIKVSFTRIGMVASNYLSSKFINKAHDKFLNMESLPGMRQFNLSWYRSIESKYGLLNCWERIITDEADPNTLLMQFDINSAMDVKVDFSMKFIKGFLNTAEDIMEERCNF